MLKFPETSLKGRPPPSFRTSSSFHANRIERTSALLGIPSFLICLNVPLSEKSSTLTSPLVRMGNNRFSIHKGKSWVGKIFLNVTRGIKGLSTLKDRWGFEVCRKSSFELAVSEKSETFTLKDETCKIFSE